jgi:hypothetical protein
MPSHRPRSARSGQGSFVCRFVGLLDDGVRPEPPERPDVPEPCRELGIVREATVVMSNEAVRADPGEREDAWLGIVFPP